MAEKLNSNVTDKELIAGLESNDIASSVEFLYEQYFESIIEFVKFRGGGEEDGADLFQESVLVMIEKIKDGKFRGESSIKTYLFGIVRNLWLMELRTRERRKKREEYYASSEPLIAQTPDFKKANVDLKEVFGQLGESCKTLLIGFYFENKTMKDLLSQFDFKNEQVLRNKKNICMKKLKELLNANKNLLQSLKSDYVYE
jgi:RNA polymerase sigma factor (sigma-70 family)